MNKNVFIGRLRGLWLSLIFILGCVSAFYLYHERRKDTDKVLHSYFVYQAQSVALHAQRLLQEDVQILDAFAAFFAASNEVTQAEFQAFASHLLAQHPEVTGVHWAPCIEAGQRTAFEEQLRDMAWAPRHILDAPSAPQTTPQMATVRPLYIPVYFAEPLKQNQSLIGLDIATEAPRRTALERAAQSRQPQATAPFSVGYDPQKPVQIAIYLPVFLKQSLREPAQPPSVLQGYLGLELSPEVLLKQRMGNEPTSALSLVLSDVLTQQIMASAGPSHSFSQNAVSTLNHQVELELPERTWTLSIASPPLNTDHTPEWLLGSLLLLTAFITLATAQSMHKMRRLVHSNLQLRQQSELLSQRAHTDSLTGLPNRAHLQELVTPLLRAEVKVGAQSAICMLDLDQFKAVNDQLGHGTGDMLLQMVAQILQTNIRQGDIAARLGGDEFVLVFPLLNQGSELKVILERLQTQIRYQTQKLIPPPIQVTASIGVALSSRACRDFDTLLNRADQAMYQAKQQGKDRFCFYTKPSA